MHYTYILKLKNNSFYHGSSDDLQNRIKEHKKGKVTSTKNHLPAKLVFYAAFSSKKLATAFEKYLKSSSGFAFRNKRLISK